MSLRSCRALIRLLPGLLLSLLALSLTSAQTLTPNKRTPQPPLADWGTYWRAPQNAPAAQSHLAPQLDATLTPAALSLTPGVPFTLTVTLTNTGAVSVTHAAFSLQLPPQITYHPAQDTTLKLIAYHLPGEEELLRHRLILADVTLPVSVTLSYPVTLSVLPDAPSQLAVTLSAGSPFVARSLSAETTLANPQAQPSHTHPQRTLTSQGGNSDNENGWTPTFHEPDVSAFSGAVTYAYPLDVPPGRNGLQPNLSLNYSSAGVDGLLDNITSGWVGLGWNLEQIDIVRTNVKTVPGSDLIQYDNDFLLTLNGASYRLYPHPDSSNPCHGRYSAEGSPELYIERLQQSPANTTGEYFIVKTPAGITYHLGYSANSEQLIYPSTHRAEGFGAPCSGNIANYTAYRFRVDQVEDLDGNTMVYTYQEERTGPQQNPGNREIGSYLTSIRYNNLLHTADYLSEIKFILGGQGGYPPPADDADRPIFQNTHLLDRVQILWNGVIQREYDLSYTTSTERVVTALLTQIQEYGRGGLAGGQPLPPTQLFYTLHPNKGACLPQWTGCDNLWKMQSFDYERLSAITNGYGGRFEFTYASDDRNNWWEGYLTYHITQQTSYAQWPGGAPTRVTDYTYGPPCYDQSSHSFGALAGSVICPGPKPELVGPRVGHAWTLITVKNSSGVPLAVTQHSFHAEENVSSYLRGRQTETRTLHPQNTDRILSLQTSTYEVNSAGCPNNGAHSFVCLTASETTLYSAASAHTTRRTTYSYDPAYQGGAQYGNQTGVTEWVDGVAQRTTRRWYFPATPATDDWLVNRLGSEGRYVGDGWELLSATWSIYDNKSDWLQPPTQGHLTRSRQIVQQYDSCDGLPGLDLADCAHAFQTSDTTYAYDSEYPGVATAHISYRSYGYQGFTETWDPLQTENSYPTLPVTTTTTTYLHGLLPSQTSNYLEHTTATTYDPQWPWLPAAVTDPNNATTQYAYDNWGRPIKIARPGDSLTNPTIQYTYWDNGPTQFLNPLLIQTDYAGGLQASERHFYDGLGRAIQSQIASAELADGNTGNTLLQDLVSVSVYDALGRPTCQSLPQTVTPYVWNGQSPYRADTDCAADPQQINAPHSLGLSYSQTPDGRRSYQMNGVSSQYSWNPANQLQIHYQDDLGRLSAVDESDIRFADEFTAFNATNWPAYGSGGTRNAVGGALQIMHQAGNNNQFGVQRPVAANSDESVSLTFSASGNHTIIGETSWLSLERGTWGTGNYRLWGIIVQQQRIKLQTYSGNTQTQYDLLPFSPNVWYRLVLRTSNDAGREFRVAVWQQDDSSQRAEYSFSAGWNYTDWKFTAKTNFAQTLNLDTYAERDIWRTRYSYDLLDQLTSVTEANAGANATTMTYDLAGRKTEMNDPDMGQWKYTYDPQGNLVQQDDACGNRLCLYYDDLNRLTMKAAYSNSEACPVTAPSAADSHMRAVYTYDENIANGKGRLYRVGWEQNNNWATYEYDNRGRVTKETRRVQGIGAQYMSNTYDNVDRLLSVNYPSDGSGRETVSYTYNAQGQPESLSGLISAATYNRFGGLVTLQRLNGQTTRQTYYSAAGNYRLESRQHAPGANLWPDYWYNYDAVGNITSLGTNLSSGNDTQSYSYDALNRLTAANGTNPTYSDSYTYAANGNISQFDVATYNYVTRHASCLLQPSHSQPHAVKQVQVNPEDTDYYCYDANGNMTLRVENDISYSQVFDVENRLQSVTPSGGVATSFTYDAAGQRMKSVRPDGTTLYTPFATYERQVGGGATIHRKQYLFGGEVIAVRVTGDPVSGNNGLFYRYSDHLGSTSVLGKAGASSPQSDSIARYYPFGDWRTEPAQTITSLGYTGHRHNNQGSGTQDVGLIYMNARYYLPHLGRFASPDTLAPDPANPQAFNRYAYVLNNPLAYTDPSGHCAEPAGFDDPDWAEINGCQRIRGDVLEIYRVIAEGIWGFEEIQALLKALQNISTGFGGDQYVKTLLGGTKIIRHEGSSLHNVTAEVMRPNRIDVYDSTFTSTLESAVLTLIHEFGHILDADNWLGLSRRFEAATGGKTMNCLVEVMGIGYGNEPCGYRPGGQTVSNYGTSNRREDFADSFAVYMFQEDLTTVMRHDLTVTANTEPSIQTRMDFIAGIVDVFTRYYDWAIGYGPSYDP